MIVLVFLLTRLLVISCLTLYHAPSGSPMSRLSPPISHASQGPISHEEPMGGVSKSIPRDTIHHQGAKRPIVSHSLLTSLPKVEDANRENLSPWGKEVVDLQPMMDGLTSVVASLVRQLSRRRDVDEWALRPLLQDTVVPRLNDVFRAKFVEIDRFHDLGTEAREIIHYTSLDMLVVRNL